MNGTDQAATDTVRDAASPGVDTPVPAAGPTAAPAAVGQAAPTPEHPPLAGRVSYVFGGTMPARYHPWVLRDLTAPGWRRRQTLRPVLMMLPVAIVFALLPGGVVTRATLVAFLVVAPAVLGLALSTSFRNRRLAAHGFPAPTRTRARKPTEDEILDAAERAAAQQPTSTPTTGPTPAPPPAPAPAIDPDDPEGINA
jgi:hypothetical protein